MYNYPDYMTRYEIRDAFSTCDGYCDGRVADCYCDNVTLNATTDEEAIREAENLQRAHDAYALCILEAAKERGDDWKDIADMEDAYHDAPVYVHSLFRITVDENGEEAYEAVEY